MKNSKQCNPLRQSVIHSDENGHLCRKCFTIWLDNHSVISARRIFETLDMLSVLYGMIIPIEVIDQITLRPSPEEKLLKAIFDEKDRIEATMKGALVVLPNGSILKNTEEV